MKKSLITTLLLVLLSQPVTAANHTSPSWMMWQMMDLMAEMMEWFLGRNRSYPGSFGYNPLSMGQSPFALGGLSPLGLPYTNGLNSLYGTNGLNRFNGLNGQNGDLWNNPASRLGQIQALNNAWSNSPLKTVKTSKDEELPLGSFWGDSSGWGTSEEPWDGGLSHNYAGYVGFDGIWKAPTGERWVIQGSQFILYHANDGTTRGEYKVDGEWIYARSFDNKMTITFQFRQMDDLLLIRDKRGQVVLMQRIKQNEPQLGW